MRVQLYKMNDFLITSRQIIRNIKENVCIILGNESCDLDSAISSICLSYYYQNNPQLLSTNKIYSGIVPLFNVTKNDFALKTEVIYYLKKNFIEIDNITFIDNIDQTILRKNDIILVDHHVSPYYTSVIEVYDHRPFDTSSNLNTNCKNTIKEIGSCSTLIGDLYLKLDKPQQYKEILSLLYAPIILDTVNFSKEADKARDLDIETVEKIENILNIENPKLYREELFSDLVSARSDIKTLNSYQILFKDMKLISNKLGNKTVAIPGYPILVEDYIKMENSAENIKKFATIHNCSVILLMGMKILDGTVTRDLGLINITDIVLFNEILCSLIQHIEPNLELEANNNCNLLNGKFFHQKNIKASRKQILPIVKLILDEM